MFLTKFQLDQHNRSKSVHFKIQRTGNSAIKKKKMFTGMVSLDQNSSSAINTTEEIKYSSIHGGLNFDDHSRLISVCYQDEEALREAISLIEENKLLKKRLEASQKIISQIMERSKAEQFSSVNV